MYRILALSFPLSITNLLRYLVGLITISFVGRLGEFELSCAILGLSLFNVSGTCTVLGLFLFKASGAWHGLPPRMLIDNAKLASVHVLLALHLAIMIQTHTD